VNGEALQ